MDEHLRHLFEYDDWANRRTIAALETYPSDRSRRILAHILITKQEYFDRLGGKDSTGFDFWPDLDLKECRQLSDATTASYNVLLKKADESESRTDRDLQNERRSASQEHVSRITNSRTDSFVRPSRQHRFENARGRFGTTED